MSIVMFMILISYYLQKGGLSEKETNNLIEQLVDIDDKCTNVKPVNSV